MPGARCQSLYFHYFPISQIRQRPPASTPERCVWASIFFFFNETLFCFLMRIFFWLYWNRVGWVSLFPETLLCIHLTISLWQFLNSERNRSRGCEQFDFCCRAPSSQAGRAHAPSRWPVGGPHSLAPYCLCFYLCWFEGKKWYLSILICTSGFCEVEWIFFVC